MPRPLRDIPTETLQSLLSAALSPVGLGMLIEQNTIAAGPGSVAARVAMRARLEPTIGDRVERALDTVFETLSCESVACATTRLRIAQLDHDRHAAATVLWHAARREGLAWRRFEDRARNELLHVALSGDVLGFPRMFTQMQAGAA